MADRTFTYRVEIDARQAGAQAQQVRAAMERELKQIRFAPQLGTPAGGGSMPSFAPSAGGNRELIPGFGSLPNLAGYTVAGAAIGTLVTQGARLAVQLDAEATAFNRVNVAALKLAGSQENLNSLLDAYVEASGGAVDRATALQKVTELQAVGFADNAREVERFTRAARAINIANPNRSIDYITSQMQLAIANQSTMRLDQLSVGVSEFNAKLAELERTMPSLSDEMRYQEALLQTIETKFAGVTESAAAQATGVELLAAAWEDLRLEMAQHASDVVDPVARGAAAALGADVYRPRELRAELQRQADSIMQGAGGDINNVSGVRRRMIELNQLNQQVQGALAQGVEFPQSYLDALDELTEKAVLGNNVTSEMVPTFERLSGALDSVTSSGYNTFGALEDYADAAAYARSEAGQLAASQAALNEQFAEAQKLLRFSYQGDSFVYFPTVGMRPEQGPQWPGDDYFRQLSITQGGGFLTPGGGDMADMRSEWTEQWRQQNIEATRAAIRENERVARSNESAWRSTAESVRRDFRDVAEEVKSTIMDIPGLFGASSVTAEQMQLAEWGVPQRFADDLRRRLEDEVLNGVDWSDIDPASIFGRAGIDQTLDPRAQMALFNQKWADQSLFADADNLSFFNQDAIRAELERQRMSKLGQQNIMGMFGLGEDKEGAYFTELGGFMSGGMLAGAEEGLAEFSRDAMGRLMYELRNDAALSEYALTGERIGDALFEGVIAGATGGDIVSAITAEVMRQLYDHLPPN